MSRVGQQLILDTSIHRKAVVGGTLITELVLVNLAAIEAGEYITPMHLHPYHQVDVVLGGWVEHRIEGWEKPVRLVPGDGIVIPPLTRHGLLATEGFRHASYKLVLASRMSRAMGDRPFRFPASKLLLQHLQAATQRCGNNDPFANDVILSAGSLCLLEAVDHAPEPSHTPAGGGDFRRTILPVLERVAEAPFGGWTVSDLAHECSMSVDHFSKCFRNVLGQTPQTFILETRLRNAAADLLAEPPMTIEHVADRAGYSSRHTFTRAFSSLFDISPDAFRRSVASGQPAFRPIHH